MNKFISILIFTVSTCFSFIVIYSYATQDSKFNNELIKKTIKSNKKIESKFNFVATYVENYNKKNNHYPTKSDYTKWSKNFPDIKYIQLYTKSFPSEVIDKFGISDNGFVLELWRGEWSEYYVSWIKRSTLTLDPQKYKLSVPVLLQTLIFPTILYIASLLLWSTQLQSKIRDITYQFFLKCRLEKIYLLVLKSKSYLQIILTWLLLSFLIGFFFASLIGGQGGYVILEVIVNLSFIGALAHSFILLAWRVFSQKSLK